MKRSQIADYSIGAAATLLLCAVLNTQAQFNYTTISVPGAAETWAYGVDGDNIVGEDFVILSSSGGTITGVYQSFLYDGSTYTILNVPGAAGANPGVSFAKDGASGISGNNIVGTYGAYSGFLYNGGTYSTLSVPGAGATWANGISGNEIVGTYSTPGANGFLYDGSSYMTLNVPGAANTWLYGISGNKIVGDYTISGNGNQIGFLYDGSTYTTLSVSGAATTQAYGVSGNDIVGSYDTYFGTAQEHGFLYDGGGYTTLNVPGTTRTWAYGISGNEIVGAYLDSQGNFQGFIAIPVPEPSTMALLVLSVIAFLVGWSKVTVVVRPWVSNGVAEC